MTTLGSQSAGETLGRLSSPYRFRHFSSNGSSAQTLIRTYNKTTYTNCCTATVTRSGLAVFSQKRSNKDILAPDKKRPEQQKFSMNKRDAEWQLKTSVKYRNNRHSMPRAEIVELNSKTSVQQNSLQRELPRCRKKVTFVSRQHNTASIVEPNQPKVSLKRGNAPRLFSLPAVVASASPGRNRKPHSFCRDNTQSIYAPSDLTKLGWKSRRRRRYAYTRQRSRK
jgi:hypothetical protein